jgi:hypothetical protein
MTSWARVSDTTKRRAKRSELDQSRRRGLGQDRRTRSCIRKNHELNSAEIRRFLGSYGLALLEWDWMHTDILTIQESGVQVAKLSDDNAAAPQLIAQQPYLQGLESVAANQLFCRKR